ncbi:YggT family protein [Oenococcus kitaharae]|uniref:Cell division membrane protein n=1 Tax=Oenococcus kitaharae DSM 17330 TaxID=1045004 RepID=G9WH01_9LACO|nr:YggT family protein [Oenococcus kitaharae]EHN59409.1 Cell division membrane protein [Oenococcus kitaharae DSM 17330]
MPVSNILYYLYALIHWAVNIYSWIIVFSAIITWLPNLRASRLAYWLNRLTQPYVGFFQRLIPPIVGIDFSPLIALLVLQFADRALFAIFVQLF